MAKRLAFENQRLPALHRNEEVFPDQLPRVLLPSDGAVDLHFLGKALVRVAVDGAVQRSGAYNDDGIRIYAPEIDGELLALYRIPEDKRSVLFRSRDCDTVNDASDIKSAVCL